MSHAGAPIDPRAGTPPAAGPPERAGGTRPSPPRREEPPAEPPPRDPPPGPAPRDPEPAGDAELDALRADLVRELDRRAADDPACSAAFRRIG